MQAQHVPKAALTQRKASAQSVRLEPIIDIAQYDTTALMFETVDRYDAPLRFGPAFSQTMSRCPAEFTACAVETALCLASVSTRQARPIHVAAPLAALLHPDTPAACVAAIRRAHACPQEICLDFEDAAFTADTLESVTAIRRLCAVGLRVGIDSRSSWCATTSVPLRMLIDTVHVLARDLVRDPILIERVGAAAKEGIAIVVHRPLWQDTPAFEALGAKFVCAAQADA